MRARYLVSCLLGVAIVSLTVGQDEPKPMGWRPLFNGKDLEGWEGIGSSTTDDWKVVDGVLEGHGTGGGWIVAPGSYDNFRLQLEFRVSQGSNSGVFLRVPPDSSTPHVDGLEVQILDDAAEQYADVDNAKRCGSLLLEVGPSKQVSKKAGEWQKMAIECSASRARVVLNGEMIVDVDLAKNRATL